jgi:hypothetical protein
MSFFKSGLSAGFFFRKLSTKFLKFAENIPAGSLCAGSFTLQSLVLVTRMGFGLVIGFINHSQVVTTINYNTIPDYYTIYKALHTTSFSISPLLFTGF